MNIFNSLGSNYNFNFILKALFNLAGNPKELEKILADKYQGKATLLYKGREAIEAGLTSLNLPPDSFAAINGFTCVAVYEAIKKAGLDVEFLDIEKGELNFSGNELEKHLQKNQKIKVVIVQNTLGYPCEIDEIAKICQQNNLILVEDLAHCVGTRYKNGKQAGNIGDMVVLSFSQDKMIDGISGGALISQAETNLDLNEIPQKKQLIDRFYPFSTFIIRKTYPLNLGKIIHALLKSLKLLSNPMGQLEEGLHQLPRWYCSLIEVVFTNLQHNLDHRKKIATIYAQNLNPKIMSAKINSTINLSANLRFPIFVNKRGSLIRYLKQSGIHVADIWYDEAPDQCPNAELACDEILNLPTHLNVSEKDAERIVSLINKWLSLN